MWSREKAPSCMRFTPKVPGERGMCERVRFDKPSEAEHLHGSIDTQHKPHAHLQSCSASLHSARRPTVHCPRALPSAAENRVRSSARRWYAHWPPPCCRRCSCCWHDSLARSRRCRWRCSVGGSPVAPAAPGCPPRWRSPRTVAEACRPSPATLPASLHAFPPTSSPQSAVASRTSTARAAACASGLLGRGALGGRTVLLGEFWFCAARRLLEYDNDRANDVLGEIQEAHCPLNCTDTTVWHIRTYVLVLADQVTFLNSSKTWNTQRNPVQIKFLPRAYLCTCFLENERLMSLTCIFLFWFWIAAVYMIRLHAGLDPRKRNSSK